MDKLLLARFISFCLVWANQIAVAKGHNPLPVVSEESISVFLTFVVSVWTMFTDNKPNNGKKL